MLLQVNRTRLDYWHEKPQINRIIICTGLLCSHISGMLLSWCVLFDVRQSTMRCSERPPTCFAVRFVNVDYHLLKMTFLKCALVVQSVSSDAWQAGSAGAGLSSERTDRQTDRHRAHRSHGMFMLAGGPACLPPEHFCCLHYFLCFILFITVKFSVDVWVTDLYGAFGEIRNKPRPVLVQYGTQHLILK